MENLGNEKPSRDVNNFERRIYTPNSVIERRRSGAIRSKQTQILKKKQGKGVLSEKNKEIIRRVYMRIRILNYMRKPKKTKIKMKKTLMKLGLIEDVEKKVTRQRKDDFFYLENFGELEDIIHNFIENKLDPSKKEKVRLTIYPTSTFKKIWDLLLMTVLTYICTIFPYRICFIGINESEDIGAFFWLDIAIDLFFLADIIFNFLFAIEKEGIIVDSKKEIAKNYLKTWFLPDLVSIIPFYLMGNNNNLLQTNKDQSLLKIFKFFRLVKSVRIFKGNPVFDRIMFNLKLSVITKQILKNLVYLIFFIHFVGCIWYFLGNLSAPSDSWLYPIGLYDADNFTKYLTSIYFAIVVSFTVGYGDITPVSYTEHIFVVFYLIIGVSLYSYTISNLTSLFGRLSAKDNYLQEKEIAIKIFSINHNLSDDLYQEIRDYLIDNDTKQSNFLFEKQLISNVNELTNYLPTNLYYELYVNNFKKQLKKLPLLEGCDDKFYLAFISIFEIRLFNKNDIVFKPGDLADEVYIVWKGRFCMINSLNLESYDDYLYENKKNLYYTREKNSILSKRRLKNIYHRRKMQEELLKIMTYFNSKDMFGENDLKRSSGKVRKFTVKAKKDSVVIILYKNDIKYLCDLNPHFKKVFEDSQRKKEAVTKLIFDGYKKKADLLGNIQQNISSIRLSNQNQNSSSLINFNSKLTLTNKLLHLQSAINPVNEKEEILRLLVENKEYKFLESIAPDKVEKKQLSIVNSPRKKLFSANTDGNCFYNDNNSVADERDFVKKLLNPDESFYPSSPISINKSLVKLVRERKVDSVPLVLHKMEREDSKKMTEESKSFHSESENVSNRKSDTRNLIKLKSRKSAKSANQTYAYHSLSMIDLPVKINLENFENRITNMREHNNRLNIRLMKMFKQKKFQVIKSEIFPVIHELNIKMKEIFEIMRNFIYQFEEVRRKVSINTPDTIREARQSINDSFSMYYETIEILNKLGTVNMTDTLEILSKFTKKAVLFFEQRFNMLQIMSSNNINNQ